MNPLLIFLLIFNLAPSLFAAPQPNKLAVEEISIAKSDQEITTLRVSKPFKFNALIKDGDQFNNNATFGVLTNAQGKKMPGFVGSHDGNSLFVFADTAYLLTHIETVPGGVYLTQLVPQGDDIKAIATRPVDLSSVGGVSTPCAASKTPWGTHLGGEEDYYLNSIYADQRSPFYIDCTLTEQKNSKFCKNIASMQAYLDDSTIDPAKGYNGTAFSLYNYGSTFEIEVNKMGKTKVAKHYVTGKYTPELAYVMPDSKTIYMTDDGEDKGIFKFVSEQAIDSFNDNWQGSLYIAKMQQTNKANGGHFTITWIELGKGSDKTIKALIDKKLILSDMFDIKQAANCEDEYRSINEDGYHYCLRLKTGKSKSQKFTNDGEVKMAAAFLESRKYGAYLGGTTELRKAEGLAYNAMENALYMAISQITNGMADSDKAKEKSGDIRLDKNSCGAIYKMPLDSKFNAVNMQAVLTGKPLQQGDKFAAQNNCGPHAIANPDNILFGDDETLYIAEDSKNHLNNILWSFNIHTKRLTRIASLPTGAEVAGMVRAKLFSKEVLLMNIQHPFKSSSVNAAREKVNDRYLKAATHEQKRGIVGYIEAMDERLLR